jgi:hypothetical protein
MTTSTPTRAQAAQLLKLLYQYLVANTATHPVLLQAVVALQGAAQLYRPGTEQQAYAKGVEVFHLLQQARMNAPDLPLP